MILIKIGIHFIVRTIRFCRIRKFTLWSFLLFLSTLSFSSSNYHLRLDEDIAGILNSDTPFSFVVAGHVRGKQVFEINPAFEASMDEISEVNPDFIIFTGDLTFGDGGTGGNGREEQVDDWVSFQEFVDQFEIPYLIAPGNHEISNEPAFDRYINFWGPAFGFFQVRAYRFVVLNTTAFGTPDTFGIDPAQQQLLTRNPNLASNTFVFMHHPIWLKIPFLKENQVFEERFLFAGNGRAFSFGHSPNGPFWVINGLDENTLSRPEDSPFNFALVALSDQSISISRISRKMFGEGITKENIFEDAFFLEQNDLSPSGWKKSPWFGYFKDADFPWILHREHDWIYLSGPDESGFFYFDNTIQSWFWTADNIYPFVYKFGDLSGWLWFLTPSEPNAPRSFYHFNFGKFVDESFLLNE